MAKASMPRRKQRCKQIVPLQWEEKRDEAEAELGDLAEI
jgi:hypothetical protein